jgi:glutathione S-transferase
MLKIWGRSNSLNVQKAMWTVGELGVAHERLDVGGRFGGLDRPDYLRMNPNAKIPTIDDGGVIVWESNAVVRYLSARYGEGLLWDPDPAVRARADQWMDWMQTTLAPDFYELFWVSVRLPADRQKPAAIAEAARRLRAHYGVVERQLADKSFLLGERLSMADIVIGATLYRYYEMPIERPGLAGIHGWYHRLSARPAYRTHVMVSFEELRGNAIG